MSGRPSDSDQPSLRGTGQLRESGPPLIGVLALQGDVEEHLRALQRLGARTLRVRRPADLDEIDGIVLPGGESTTMQSLLHTFDLFPPLRERLAAGLPAFGSCAGMILLATEVLDGRADQVPLAIVDMAVRRNAFGRQADSFEADVHLAEPDEAFRAVFIRGPWVERVGPAVEVLARVHYEDQERIVMVRQGAILATAFHPEVADDLRVHRLFLDLVRTSDR